MKTQLKYALNFLIHLSLSLATATFLVMLVGLERFKLLDCIFIVICPIYYILYKGPIKFIK